MYSGKIFFFTRNKDNFQKVSFYSGFIISFCLRLSPNLSISAMASKASSSSSLDSINIYTNLDKMASRLHSKKNTKTKTKPKRETKTTTTKKKMEKQREFPTYKMLKTCSLGWRCEITSFCSGEIKTKAPIIIYHGGGERKNEGGDRMVFRGTEWGEKQSLLTEYKGGGAIRHWLPMRGIIKILQRFRGGTRLISVWYNKYPPLGNIYSDWSQTWQSLHG